jgi:hypothetical protein
VTALAAKIMAAAQKLALGTNESGTSETTPVSGEIGVIFAKSSCHNRRAVFVLETESCHFKVILWKNQGKNRRGVFYS